MWLPNLAELDRLESMKQQQLPGSVDDTESDKVRFWSSGGSTNATGSPSDSAAEALAEAVTNLHRTLRLQI